MAAEARARFLADRRNLLALGAAVAVLLGSPPLAAAEDEPSISELGSLSIEDLANVEITSVSKRPEPLASAPAAIYVISNDDIRASGAITLPDALRLAPNLQVARVNASTYGITARGFNQSSATANKMQVLIDGRSVYNPLFSGVFWDIQNVVLADVDRIEVVSGPAGALWGSNAVNGVINVVTRSAAQTQGLLVDATYGGADEAINVRYGGKIGDNLAYRIYGLGFSRDNTVNLSGLSAYDGWHMWQGGARADWTGAKDSVTLQGDRYSGDTQKAPAAVTNSDLDGGNVMLKWSHKFDDGSSLDANSYYSRTVRQLTTSITARVNTYDFDLQRHFVLGTNDLVVGAGYRETVDEFNSHNSPNFLDPSHKALRLANVFGQDKIALSGDLDLILGLKYEHNSYTGSEWMPDARIAWRPWKNTLLWGAVSRAVRTPSRYDRDLYIPNTLDGGPDFVSEELTAYEVGYRGRPLPNVSVSVSAYYNVYDNLRTLESIGATRYPLEIRNGMAGSTYGVEAWSDWAVTPWWRLSAGYNYLHKDLRIEPGSTDAFGVLFAGNDPTYQAQVRSYMKLPGNLELDAGLRAIDSLPSPAVPSYVEMDVRIGWMMTKQVELSVGGDNLLHSRHVEFDGNSTAARELPRTLYAGMRWRF